MHSLQDDLKKEKALREKVTREKDMAMSDKFSMEQTLSVSFLTYAVKNKCITFVLCVNVYFSI